MKKQAKWVFNLVTTALYVGSIIAGVFYGHHGFLMLGVTFAIFLGIVFICSPLREIKVEMEKVSLWQLAYGMAVQLSVILMLVYNGNWISGSILLIGVMVYTSVYIESREAKSSPHTQP